VGSKRLAAWCRGPRPAHQHALTRGMLPPAPQAAAFMAHMWEDLRAHYRPLAFYVLMELGAGLTWAAMLAMGFRCRKLG
jgi:hypothetical protein